MFLITTTEKEVLASGVTPWYANIMNYLVSGYVPPEFISHQRKRFFHLSKRYFWDESFLYKRCVEYAREERVKEDELMETDIVEVERELEEEKTCGR